jgi:glycerol uptake facilitator protein
MSAAVTAPALGRRLLAEALGTALLVLFGAGSAVAAVRTGAGPHDYAATGVVALAFGLVVMVAIHAFGPTSGAHINPAVTIALASRRRFPAGEVVPYVAAQIVGAFAGALLIVAIFGTGAADAGTGGTSLAGDVSWLQGVVGEAAGTFLLVTAIFAVAVDARAPAGWAGLIIGLAVTCAILLLAPLTGGSLNPARTLGPLLTTALWDGKAAWDDLSVYLVGPIAGGVLAAWTYELVAHDRPRRK